jgi:Fe2+ transport system protein B
VFFKRKPATAFAEGDDVADRPVQREKLSWLEKRDRRRRRRKIFEEVLGWIVVPAVVYLIYLGVQAVGGIPKELIDFGNELIAIAMKGGR